MIYLCRHLRLLDHLRPPDHLGPLKQLHVQALSSPPRSARIRPRPPPGAEHHPGVVDNSSGSGWAGHYARARAALDVLDRRTSGFSVHSDRVLASLSASTRASFLRQSGRHALASTWDGRALAIVGGLQDDPEAACDALTGLAADALGCGRLPLGWRLLAQCRARLGDEAGLWRQEIRIEWVSAELALAGGDFARAGRHAERAVELSGNRSLSGTA
ncbi:hypothetical protein GCM10020255_065800 [Rhodococcus baikonurensis]